MRATEPTTEGEATYKGNFGCRAADASDSLSHDASCPSLRRRMRVLEGRVTEGFTAIRSVGLGPHVAHDSARIRDFARCTAAHLAHHAT